MFKILSIALFFGFFLLGCSESISGYSNAVLEKSPNDTPTSAMTALTEPGIPVLFINASNKLVNTSGFVYHPGPVASFDMTTFVDAQNIYSMRIAVQVGTVLWIATQKNPWPTSEFNPATAWWKSPYSEILDADDYDLSGARIAYRKTGGGFATQKTFTNYSPGFTLLASSGVRSVQIDGDQSAYQTTTGSVCGVAKDNKTQACFATAQKTYLLTGGYLYAQEKTTYIMSKIQVIFLDKNGISRKSKCQTPTQTVPTSAHGPVQIFLPVSSYPSTPENATANYSAKNEFLTFGTIGTMCGNIPCPHITTIDSWNECRIKDIYDDGGMNQEQEDWTVSGPLGKSPTAISGNPGIFIRPVSEGLKVYDMRLNDMNPNVTYFGSNYTSYRARQGRAFALKNDGTIWFRELPSATASPGISPDPITYNVSVFGVPVSGVKALWKP